MISRSIALSSIAGFCAVALTAAVAQASCGDSNFDGKISAADALFTLRASVGQVSCELELCDVDENGEITVTDALRVLKAATGQNAALACVSLQKTPTDPGYSEQYGLASIHAPQVWPTRTSCSNLIISVVDTGIDYFHEDLVENLWTNPGEIPFNNKDDDNNGFADDIHGWDFCHHDKYPEDLAGHGTHVAGIIGAAANNGKGGTGVCWNARIMAAKFLCEDGFGFGSDALQAIDYSRKNGAKVINNSWGGGPRDSGVYFALKAASDADISLVMSAGNDSDDNDHIAHYPSNYLLPSQINVAAIDDLGKLAAFSNFGSKYVHVAAPGVDVYSTFKQNSYEFLDGTSMAAPHVTGAVALLRAQFPHLDAITVKNIMIRSSTPSALVEGAVMSNGTLNLQAAFAAAANESAASAAIAYAVVEPAPPSVSLRERHTLERFHQPGRKYPNLQRAAELYDNGTSKIVTMVADHLVVTLDDEAALDGLVQQGFKIRSRLATDRLTVLVEAPVSTDETEARLQGVKGVESVTPDYLVSAD